MKKTTLVIVLLLSSVPVNAHEFRSGYSRSQVCSRAIYKERYIPGTSETPGHIKSWTEYIEEPCYSSGRRASSNHPHYRYQKNHFKHHHYYPIAKSYDPKNSCNSARSTAGGILGGGLAAALSKKDAYGWSVPLGAVLGMGVANSDC